MIETKPKKCKSQGKAKGFEGCGELSLYRTYGLCQGCFKKWIKTTKEGFNHVISNTIPKVRKSKEEETKQREKEFKDKNKSMASLIGEVRVPFHKYIRIRDANDGCISCGTGQSANFQAGHYKKAELFRGSIFDEINTNKQCYKCNVYLSGNESGYREGLVKKYGEEATKELEQRANKNRAYDWNREQLKEIKKEYLEKCREILK